MARIGMLDVPGHESRHFATGRALRFDQQPQFRRTAGAWRTDAFSQSHDGGGRGDCGTFHGRKELAVSVTSGGDGALPRPSGAKPRFHTKANQTPWNHFASTVASSSRLIR